MPPISVFEDGTEEEPLARVVVPPVVLTVVLVAVLVVLVVAGFDDAIEGRGCIAFVLVVDVLILEVEEPFCWATKGFLSLLTLDGTGRGAAEEFVPAATVGSKRLRSEEMLNVGSASLKTIVN